MPLTLATSNTTVVLVGDHKQLQPSLINRENCEFMKTNQNLLERYLERCFEFLYKTKSSIQKMSGYFVMLSEVHRAVREIVEFISHNFYNGKLEAKRMYVDCASLRNYYPIQFVEFDEDGMEVSDIL